jgi:hypothetical protein
MRALLFSRHRLAYAPACMPLARTLGLCFLVAVPMLPFGSSHEALAQHCKPGSAGAPGTLAAPDACPPPASKAKPVQKKTQQPDGFWSGIRIGGSVSTTTTIRGR